MYHRSKGFSGRLHEMKVKITSHMLTAALRRGGIETGKYGKSNVTGYKGYRLLSDLVEKSVKEVNEVEDNEVDSDVSNC